MGHLLDWYTDPEKFQGEVNLKVIKFIDEITNFPDRDGDSGEQIDHLFSAGYCYYFASMLKTAFGGQLCWAQDRGHIVWADIQEGCTFDELQKACAYDISGIFDDYEVLWPVSYLGDAIVDYLHNEQAFHMNDRFKNWCDFCHVTEMYAVDMIWWTIPVEEIKAQYHSGSDYVQTAYQYWMEHASELQQIIRYRRSHKFFCPDYAGIEACMAEVGSGISKKESA